MLKLVRLTRISGMLNPALECGSGSTSCELSSGYCPQFSWDSIFLPRFFLSLNKKSLKSPKSEHFLGRKELYPHSAWHCQQAEAFSCSGCLSIAPSMALCKFITHSPGLPLLTLGTESWTEHQSQEQLHPHCMNEKENVELFVLAHGESGIEWCMIQDRFLTKTAKTSHVHSSVLQPLLAVKETWSVPGQVQLQSSGFLLA